MEWSPSFYAHRRGDGCPMCAEHRQDDVGYGLRFLEGETADAYLQRAKIQRGYAVVVWRGRHVAEPTELEDEEVFGYLRDVLCAARALEQHFGPVKTNYNTLGNSMPHLHTHVIPRYADDPKPGWPFPFPDGDPGRWGETEVRADVDALRAITAG